MAWFDDLTVADAEYQLHPAVLDACFQVLVATDPFRTPEGGPAKTYLPVGIDRVAMRQRPSGAMWAWAKLERRDQSGAKGSIYLCDSDGSIAMTIEGFEVKALDQVEGALTQEQMQRSLYNVHWAETPVEPSSARTLEGERWLLCADATGVAAELAAKLEAAGAEVVCARPGDAYRVSGDRTIVLNAAVPEHFTRLLEDTARGSTKPLTSVVHLWNLDLGSGMPETAVELECAEITGCLSALHLTQALAFAGGSAKLWFVTRGAQDLNSGDAVSVMQAPVWGLGRVVGHQEHIGMWGGLIDLDPSGTASEAAELAAEMTARTEEDQIAFRKGERYAARLEHATELQGSLPVRLKTDATYVVTGAFGALGILTSRWMVKQGARKLILMGRSTLPERARWNDSDLNPDAARRVAVIRELESTGASVMVAPIDVGNESQLAAFLTEFAQTGWPAIRGVIHSAGIVQDQLLLQMDAASFNRVLRPKVHGAWNLHRALAGSPLDFFVLYSSIGSLVAATGQANYASANAFLDALAHYRHRQGLPAISINWGPWAAGMVADLNLAEHYAMRGLDVITPDHGMRFLAHLIGQRTPQAAVLSADWRRLFEFQPKVCPMLAHLAAESQSDAGETGQNSTEDFLEVLLMAEESQQTSLLEEHLRLLASRVLRMDQQKIDVTEPLSAFGLDSMMATELKNRLELSLRIPISVLDLLKGISLAEFAAVLLPRLLEENAEIRQLLDELDETPEADTPALMSPAAVAESPLM